MVATLGFVVAYLPVCRSILRMAHECADVPADDAPTCSLALHGVARMHLDEIAQCWNQSATTRWRTLSSSARQATFEDVYSERRWSPHGEHPLSGLGSSVAWTTSARAALLHTIKKYNVKHLVDVPCGDLTWMSTMFPIFERLNVRYTGIDIVRSQIASHKQRFEVPGVREFSVLDLVDTPPPLGDLYFSRQMTQHMNAYDVLRMFHKWSRLAAASPALLLTTSYEKAVNGNFDPRLPGHDMIFLDFSQPPFNFPRPMEAFVEQRKSAFVEELALWRLPLMVRGCPGDTLTAD